MIEEIPHVHEHDMHVLICINKPDCFLSGSITCYLGWVVIGLMKAK